MRIIPKEITKEKSQSSSWFSSGAKSPDPSVIRTSGKNSPVSKTSNTSTPTPSMGHTSGFGPNTAAHQDIPQKLQTNYHITSSSALANKASSPFVPVATDFTPMSPKGDVSDTFSEASYSSEMEMEKYLQGSVAAAGISTNYQLECEEFLKSLPPIKPINLEAYTAVPLLPPRSEKLLDRKQKSAAASKAQSANDKTAHSENKANIGSRKGSSTSLHSADSPAQSTRTNSTSGTPLLTRMADFYTPDSKINSTSQQLSPFTTQNQTTSTANQSAYTQSVAPEGISPGLPSFNKKHFDELLKEKARLQGQLEILTEESQSMLQVRMNIFFFFFFVVVASLLYSCPRIIGIIIL